ncbi:hypothetical protein BKA63DRAFT_522502 [Paraphoma chrysanthemicola]|nr:hypothetical protein BKA63DRAFT_522502 [Paraphoma chrysanthemicola]
MTTHFFHALQEPLRWWPAAESTTALTTLLLGLAAGAFVLYKSLELVGYPVWRDESADAMQRGGGMLGAIFGLTSESLLQKGVRGLTAALSTSTSHAPPGLGNISNSCYQNSIIQGLAALPSLQDYLAQVAAEHASFVADTTNGALYELLCKLNDPGNRGQNFWIRGKLKSMSTFTQQDAQEYYSKILDELDTEVKRATTSKRRTSVSWLEATKAADHHQTSESHRKGAENAATDRTRHASEQLKMVPNPLDGLIAQRVGCTSCGYSEGLSLISFNCITVSLGSDTFYDIRDCLDEYTKLEFIDGVECAKCTLLKLQKTLTPLATANPASSFEAKLKTVSQLIEDEKFDDNTLVKTLNIAKRNWVQSSKSKQIVIARAPKSLVLHVNRSIFDEVTGAQYKNLAGVSYPRVLDLGDWCLGSCPSGSGQPDMSLEEWSRDPKQSMLPHQTGAPTVVSPFQYRLRAVVTHFGSHGNGHYICYRPLPIISPDALHDESCGEQWWRFSDDSVYAVPDEQAHQTNVFMLFYERIAEPARVLTNKSMSESDTVAVVEHAPLPPESLKFSLRQIADSEIAIAVPLPDDIDVIQPDTSPSLITCNLESAVISHHGVHTSQIVPTYPAPRAEVCLDLTAGLPKIEQSHTKSVVDSEDERSTHDTSDSEAEFPTPPTTRFHIPLSPHLMRTAGTAARRDQGGRQSLPLISAT